MKKGGEHLLNWPLDEPGRDTGLGRHRPYPTRIAPKAVSNPEFAPKKYVKPRPVDPLSIPISTANDARKSHKDDQLMVGRENFVLLKQSKPKPPRII